VWQPSRLTKLPHISRPIGRPGFDSFLTNRVLTKFRQAKRREKPYKTRHFVTSTKCRGADRRCTGNAADRLSII
jgi:hypothetical protein